MVIRTDGGGGDGVGGGVGVPLLACEIPMPS